MQITISYSFHVWVWRGREKSLLFDVKISNVPVKQQALVNLDRKKIIEVLTFTIRSREEAEKQHDGLFRTCEMKIYERKRPSCDLKLLLTQLTSEFFVKLAAGKYQTW